MPKLVFRSAARKDLAGIARYIGRESSQAAADSFIDKFGSHCARLATCPDAWEGHAPSWEKIIAACHSANI